MKPIIKWQYSKLEDTLGLLEEHISDPDCPCSSEGEACPRKHLKRAEAYAAETIAILTRSDGHGDEIEKLAEMAEEAKKFRLVEEKKLCGGEVGEDESVSIGWAGTWRKYFENLVVGSCDLPPLAPALVEELAKTFQPFYPEFKPEPTLVHVGPGLKGIIPKELSFTKVQTKLIRSRSYDPAKAPAIKQVSDLQPYFRLMRNADQEWLLAIYADHRGHVIGADEISIGERFGTTLSLDTVYRSAILLNASKIFLAHNHPSGSPEPSEDDIKIFENMRDYCPLLNITVEDFIVVGANEDFSIRGNRKLPAPTTKLEEVARMFRKKAEPRWCHPVKETDRELGKLSRTLGTAKKRIAEIQRSLEMPINICRGQAEMFESTTGVLDPYGSRCRNPETGQWVYSEECGFEPAGITTTALGMDGLTRYEFEFKIVSLDKLIVSHDPFTFTPNPNYPEELQPRLRERAATKIQVEKIAANLEPDAVITDFHVIDRGTPIVGPDLVVEAGNGRVMGIIRAAADYPEKYSDYKNRLRERARDYGLSAKDVDLIENPVLIRVRITDVDRTTFTQEANQAATIAPSAIENARIDAQKITLGMLQELIVGENEGLEDALRAPKNQVFAKRFLATLPENVQAALVDAQGYLNRDGVHRMAMGIFVSAFQGDAGLRLAEKAFESIDMDVRNTVNAIARSLGTMAQAEALIRTGERDTALSIGDDLAQTVNVYSAIKRNPALTVEKYLAQEQIFGRELTPFQEKILVVLDEYRRSPKKLAGIFTAYAEGVIKAPPPAQAALIPGVEITKEGLWESAIKAPEAQPMLVEEVTKMFDKRDNGSGMKDEVIKAMMVANLKDIAKFTPGECRHVGAALNALVTASREITDLVTNKRLWGDEELHSRHWQIYHTIGQASQMLDSQMETYCSREASMGQPVLSGIGSAAITGIGIGAGFKFVDWLARKFSEKGTELGAPMKLLTKEIRDKLPPLYSQEKVQDPMVWVKFFTPDSNWTWYGIEFDGEDRFFGWVVGFEKELGYFSLSELESARGPLGLPIERDRWFTPQPLSEVKKLHQLERGEMANKLKQDKFIPKELTEDTIVGYWVTGEEIPAGRLTRWAYKLLDKAIKEKGELTEQAPYARQLPAYVDVFKTTIAKHYRPTEDFHEGSIRVVKPEPDVLVYLGCLKGDDWDAEAERCSPNPTVVKTIVPNTKKYLAELEHLKLVHPEVKVNYRTKEVGVEPVVSEEEQEELEAVGEALDKAEVI